MARAKYKIDNFVKLAAKDDQPAGYGVVDEIHSTREGTKYLVTVNGRQDQVVEDAIEACFVQRQTRAKSAEKPKTFAKKKNSAEHREARASV